MTDWGRARCIGKADLFFSDEPEDVIAAKKVCSRCPLMVPCLSHAIKYRETYGVWAGLDYEELRNKALELGHEPPDRDSDSL